MLQAVEWGDEALDGRLVCDEWPTLPNGRQWLDESAALRAEYQWQLQKGKQQCSVEAVEAEESVVEAK